MFTAELDLDRVRRFEDLKNAAGTEVLVSVGEVFGPDLYGRSMKAVPSVNGMELWPKEWWVGNATSAGASIRPRRRYLFIHSTLIRPGPALHQTV